MKPTRTPPLMLLAFATALISWAGVQVWMSWGHQPPAVPWTTPGVIVVSAFTVLAFGWPVRRWQRGARDRPLDALRAARTVILAKAVQVAAALFTGWYAAQVLAVLDMLSIEPRRAFAVRAAVSLTAAVTLWIAGFLVERWCRVDAGDDPSNPPDAAASPAGGARA